MAEYIETPGQHANVREHQEIRSPRMYRVLLHNDHYTTMEFVVAVLESVFHKQREEAMKIMMNVHRNGVGVAGVYPAEVAETKVDTVLAVAKEHEFPLRCSMEPE